MRVAVIGAGFTGLSAAYELAKAGHQVEIFEKNRFAGGLASGIQQIADDYPPDWEWDLERFYHHWFTNDSQIEWLVRELGVEDKLLTLEAKTSVFYQDKTYLFDSPLSVLTFPHLSWLDRLRLGGTVAYLKLTPSWQNLEKVAAHEWWLKWIGSRAYATIWGPLLKGKFGEENYQKINMAWFWARIHKRTPKLRYFEEGFQSLINELVAKIQQMGGQIHFGVELELIKPQNHNDIYHGSRTAEKSFDRVIVTTPPQVLKKLVPGLPAGYQRKLAGLPGIGAYCLVLALDKPLLTDGTYWLNINQSGFPFLAVVEHTNLVEPKHYGNKHIVYIGNYLLPDHPDMQTGKEELIKKIAPYLKRINPSFEPRTLNSEQSRLFREPYAQPLVFINHSRNVLPLATPLPGLYLASMSQVYPWDRGTNYAVEMGRQVARLALEDLKSQFKLQWMNEQYSTAQHSINTQ